MSSLTAPTGTYQINYAETAHCAEFEIEFPTKEAVQLFKQTTELLQAQFQIAELLTATKYVLKKFTKNQDDLALTFMLTAKRLNSFLGSQFSEVRPEDGKGKYTFDVADKEKN